MSQENPWLINTTDETFQVDVMERSKLGLVVVDFWAEWCAPCRMLGPVLEKLASESDGKFTLVKAETELNATAAGEFSVSGIPAVFAVVDGQVVDRFEGAMPEPAILE
ncbi:MAG: thioredoxin domain-containing protein, partial [Planctomycetota bacterium]|nr:thioredoxin domain-containing protein [Planctomycetota bacterium]